MKLKQILCGVLSAAMMFDYFNLKEEADLIRTAVNASLDSLVRTPDIQISDHKPYSTSAVGDWLVEYINK